MSLGMLELFNPVICLGVNVLLQIVIFKLSAGRRLLRSIFYGFTISLLVLVFTEWTILSGMRRPLTESAAVFFVNLTIYCSLGYCYFHFINLGETARRVRILRELSSAKDGLSAEEILKVYNAKEIIDRRIGRLLGEGQIISNDGRYIVKEGMMVFASRMILMMRSVLFKNRSGRGPA